MNYPRVARDLMEARSLIATFGWCRGAYSLPSGARCIETALADAIGGYGERFNAACALLRSVATDALTRLCGMMAGLAFRQREPHILRSVEFTDYEMIDAFARDVGLMADNVALLVQNGRIDLKALAKREDEILANLEAADLAERAKAERKE